ncbi:ATP-binding protein [Metallumcola ferriviriculae]|uniref:ATP-binding protein n=1 Tax=Metallumcola ferriviriculae TaxID=3039180 RepID=A0AAU0US49_9FIRM|nr:ATP-binding protein [Desulfitibacteraceae bacterium MK1]
MATNSTAGIGDPYWYEWSIGLLHALDMLNPDNNIKHVILQANDLQGLDDVVVVYNNDDASCIQIKHTRESDSITFGDMVYKTESKKSLLNSMCSDWQNAQEKGYVSCKAILYTNRKIGVYKSSGVDNENVKYERPPLKGFLELINTQLTDITTLSEIEVPARWETAWKIWKEEINSLNTDDKKLNFLRTLDIKTNQDELDEIIDKISDKLSKYFKVHIRVAKQLDQKLCAALRKWTTTVRDKQEITREDLFEALSLYGDKIQGEHDLKTCEPFFSSRIDFTNELERKLVDREAPVIFLYGDPGSGKTNIVSHLANKSDSVITLRFHAFKPLSADDLYLSADKGISDPRALWGNFLVELRNLFTGKLSKYNVPVTNELLESIDDLRNEVLRLSQILADETGNTTVIAIDGIDHAARSGNTNTFLTTLVPPNGVPENVTFLISGQPIMQYDAYPDWLSNKDTVLHIEVPPINENDIKQLFLNVNQNFPPEGIDFAVKIINKAVSGNTLSAVFAVYEVAHCSNLDELETKLNESGISSGIQSYYEYIWKETKTQLPGEIFYIDTLLAGTLALINKKITPILLTDIFKDENIPELAWKAVLNRLYPIVIRENNEYRVFHNDVRIYLDNYIKRDPDNFVTISSRLADYFLTRGDDIKLKHEIGFQLLQYAKRESDFIKFYDENYIVEAIKYKRPMTELFEQLKITLLSMRELRDFKTVLSLSCAVDTLFQYQASLQWEDKIHEDDSELPVALRNEKKVLNRKLFNTSIVTNVLLEAKTLIQFKEVERAKSMLFRWFGNLTPDELVLLLNNNNTEKPEDGVPIQAQRNKDIEQILKMWGEISRVTGINFAGLDKSEATENSGKYRAIFTSGWLNEGRKYLSDDQIEYTLKNIEVYFKADFDEFFIELIENDKIEAIENILEKHPIEKMSCHVQVKLSSWAILHKKEKMAEKCIRKVLEQRFKFLVIEESERYNEKIFESFARITFILSYYGQAEHKTVNEGIISFREGKLTYKDRGYYSAFNLLESSRFFGFLVSTIFDNKEGIIGQDDFRAFVDQIFDRKEPVGNIEIGGPAAQEFLLKGIISIDHLLTSSLKKELVNLIIRNVRVIETLKNIDIWWNYLKVNNQEEALKDVFNHWMGEQGLIWNQELYELHWISSIFIPKALDMGWTEEANVIKSMLETKLVGYVGRKEYSLYTPLKWYNGLDVANKPYWETIGLKLLNISDYASKTGDNRAAVYIYAAVAASAGHFGAKSLWEFALSNQYWDRGWVQTVFDGIIASLEHDNFSEEELLSLWSIATDVFYVSKSPKPYDSENEIRCAYISDVRRTIELAASRLGYVDIGEKMKEIAELEYSQERSDISYTALIIPERWYSKSDVNTTAAKFIDEVGEKTCSEALELLKWKCVNEKNTFRWDFAIGLIKKVELTSTENILDYVQEIIDLLVHERKAPDWEYDGADRLFEIIFPYLTQDQTKALLNDIIDHYFENNIYSEDSKLYALHNDLNHFSFNFYSKLSQEEKVEGLNRILEMHSNWITGYGNIKFPITYIKMNEESENFTWKDFCIKFIARINEQL